MSELNSRNDVERALRELMPAANTLDRDRLMFRAGQVAGSPTHPMQLAATAILACAVVIPMLLLVARSGSNQVATRPVQVQPSPPSELPPRVIERQPLPPTQEPPPPPEYIDHEGDIPELGYLRLQEQIARWGLDALPTPPPETGPEVKLPPMEIERPGKSAAIVRVPSFWRFLQ